MVRVMNHSTTRREERVVSPLNFRVKPRNLGREEEKRREYH
jgi:hypothetical protein